ncbi:hypothetical protein N9850_13025 [Granulosicoccus sp.]|nr:hypothetical protein [Granulosicoccus sp.]MDB4224689.1 hypothetical protein [Granulosicoccus sp.]
MTINPVEDSMTITSALAQRVQTCLKGIAISEELITYKELADVLELMPPKTIHQLTEALEYLMKEDAKNERPFIAAFVISRGRNRLPARGFFELAQQVGRYDGDSSGPEAQAFHTAEIVAAGRFWGSA